ncbi:hypothetical protein BDN70DRAFT_81208 [Pholiota conissans]|uniref:Uncharacterized protein n=1 Tax=Pholiota conissans TaxID=109636 RepID=A0A9P6D680_9AGAR|nr:hypothetical protein BDN70DRAFT_81208 [Pholiota conissans]
MRIFHDYTDAINDATFVEHASDIAGDTDPENSSFHWEEETTLFAELMDDGPYQTEEDRLDDLVNSLQEPLTELGTQAKRNIASTLVGTINHVRKTLGLIDGNVDPYYGKGLHLFKKGSTAIEATCHARETQIKEIHEMTQQKITVLLDELKAEHEFRDKLWAKLKASINEIMNPVLETIKDAPALTERTIVKLDKQLENEDSKAVNPTQKLLQQLLMRGA